MYRKRNRMYVVLVLGVLFGVISFLFMMNDSVQAELSGCPQDITSYWKLDETSGTTFTDSVGTNDASCSGGIDCPAFTTDGRINGALVFDGAQNGLNVSPDASFNWGKDDSFSIEFWMKTDRLNLCSNYQVIVGRDDSSTPLHWWVGCRDGGVAAFRLKDTAGNNAIVNSRIKVIDDLWHHVVAVRDGGTDEIRIYVDAVRDSVPVDYTNGFDSTANLNIGWLNLDQGYHFKGAVDEVALYNRALSEAEISQHYYDGYVGLGHGYCDDCTQTARIMPLGDSITKGTYGTVETRTNDLITGYRQPLDLSLTGFQYNFNFRGSLQSGQSAVPPFDPDHEGHTGFTDTQVASSVYDWLTANGSDVVLLHIGTNDLDTDPSEVETILDEIDRKNVNTTVALARIIDRQTHSAETTQFNDNVQTMAEKRILNGDKIIIVDQEHALTYPDDMADELHPNDSGYNKMADVWLGALDKFLPMCELLAPTIISNPVTDAQVGLPYAYNVKVLGNPASEFSLMTAPPGMTINPSTGLVEWTPTEDGDVDVSVQATNSEDSDTQNYTISVGEAPLCPSRMIHYWKMDDKGDLCKDSQGANDGACSTVCPITVPGVIENAHQFSAATMVTTAEDGTFDWAASDSFSVEFWMKTASSSTCSGNQVIVGRDDERTQLHWWVGCSGNGGKADFNLYDVSGDNAVITGTTDLTDGSWHHIVAVRDGTAGENRIYVDGVLEGSKTKTYLQNFHSIVAPLNIGWLNLYPYYHFEGAVDEVALYDKALSALEVLQHYTFGMSGIGYCEAGPPSIVSTPVTEAAVGQLYTYNVDAIGNPSPTYSLVANPSGMSIKTNSGIIEWTPDSAGDFNVTVRASNGVAPPSTQDFTIHVSLSQPPSKPSTLKAKATSSTKIVLTWLDNSNNETGFKIERKLGGCASANDWSQIRTVGENVGFYTDTGRSAGTTYAYRVRSYNAGGNSDYSNCSASKTGAAGSPKAPSYLKAISASASKINLRWQDNSTDEARFKIYRKAGTGAWALLFKTAADAISYSDTTATGNNSTTSYSYYIQACNSYGCSPPTSWAIVPFAPIDLQTNAVSADQVDLTWTDMSKNESGFEVYRKAGDCKSTSSWVLRGTVAGTASYSDTHVTSGSTYSYKVRAYKRSAARPYANGYSRYSNCSSVTP